MKVYLYMDKVPYLALSELINMSYLDRDTSLTRSQIYSIQEPLMTLSPHALCLFSFNTKTFMLTTFSEVVFIPRHASVYLYMQTLWLTLANFSRKRYSQTFFYGIFPKKIKSFCKSSLDDLPFSKVNHSLLSLQVSCSLALCWLQIQSSSQLHSFVSCSTSYITSYSTSRLVQEHLRRILFSSSSKTQSSLS